MSSLGRRTTTAVTMTGLVVVLCAMAWWGYSQATKPLPRNSSDSSSSSCSKSEISKKVYVKRADVTVSVYNAGARKGFAGLTLNRLERKGFHPGAVGNAPDGTGVKYAEVFTTEKGDAAAKLVARTMGHHTKVTVSTDEMGPGVDVYVGPKMGWLNQHAPKREKLAKPILSCVRVN